MNRKNKKQLYAEKKYNAWAESIKYETEIGFIFKKKLRISTDGITWKGRFTPLENITGISGNKYKIVLQTSQGIIEIKSGIIYREKFNDVRVKIWNALYMPIAAKMLNQLRYGNTLYIGGIKFNDDGVFLNDESNSYDEKFFSWNKPLELGNQDKSLVIRLNMINTAKGFALFKYSASASYYDMNTHIFEFILRQFLEFKTRNYRLNRLSDLLYMPEEIYYLFI